MTQKGRFTYIMRVLCTDLYIAVSLPLFMLRKFSPTFVFFHCSRDERHTVCAWLRFNGFDYVVGSNMVKVRIPIRDDVRAEKLLSYADKKNNPVSFCRVFLAEGVPYRSCFKYFGSRFDEALVEEKVKKSKVYQERVKERVADGFYKKRFERNYERGMKRIEKIKKSA